MPGTQCYNTPLALCRLGEPEGEWKIIARLGKGHNAAQQYLSVRVRERVALF